MFFVNLLEFAAGLLINLLILWDVFQSIVVPRWTPRAFRLAPLLVDGLWPVWRRIGLRLHSSENREDFLGAFAPLALTLTLVAWVLCLIFGYGLVLHSLREQIHPVPESLGSSFYLAGVSLFTIGYGDMVARGGLARVAVLAAAACGLAVVALVISLIFTLFGSFQRREVLVLTLDARAGGPPSGVMLLETYAQFNLLPELGKTFADWEQWCAEVLESHRAQPILPYFRSSHQNESWISALGAMLDAATLILTTVEEAYHGPARMMHSLGVHAVLDISAWFDLPRKPDPGISRMEFDDAYDRLVHAGYHLRDPDEAWLAFVEFRSLYATPLNALAKHLATPPALWVGDRSLLTLNPIHDPSHASGKHV